MNDTPGAAAPDPGPEPSPPTGPVQGGGSGLPENVAGALSYLIGPITGIVFFIIDRDRDFVRFHAVQSIGFAIAFMALWMVLFVVGLVLNVIPILGAIIGILISLAVTVGGVGAWLWLMFQAYQGKRWEIPGLGPHVRRIAAETGGQAPPSGPAA